MKFFLFSLVFVSGLLQTANGFRCYACSGPLGHGVNCEDNLANIPKPDCGIPGGKCAKYVLKKSDSSEILFRSCVVENFCDIVDNVDVMSSCTTCDWDLCNGSIGVAHAPSSVILSSAALTALVLYMTQ